MDRILCKRLLKRHRAILTVQRLLRGKIGRMRFKREYWRSLSIVKSDFALRELLNRSSRLRESGEWSELLDPLSDSVWYFHKKTKQNTWQCPLPLQKEFICHWGDGGWEDNEGKGGKIGNFSSFGGLPPCKPCRCVFNNLEEYKGHILRAHSWYCVACFMKNTGAAFPCCSLCGNKFSDDGIDGEKVYPQYISFFSWLLFLSLIICLN
jgi:hypothetical protein